MDIYEIPSFKIGQIYYVSIVRFSRPPKKVSTGQNFSIFIDALYRKSQQHWLSFLFLKINHQIQRFFEVLTIDELDCLSLIAIENNIRWQAFKNSLGEVVPGDLQVKLRLLNRSDSHPIFGPL